MIVLCSEHSTWLVKVYKRTKTFPREELYGLRAQLRRSAVSVPSNIVEGCGRDSQADYLRFLDIANGSQKELRYQVDLSNLLEFFVDHDIQVLQSNIIDVVKVLNAFEERRIRFPVHIILKKINQG